MNKSSGKRQTETKSIEGNSYQETNKMLKERIDKIESSPAKQKKSHIFFPTLPSPQNNREKKVQTSEQLNYAL